MMRACGLALGLAVSVSPLLVAQQRIADRLAGRVTPDIAKLVEDVGTAAIARGLPVDPVIQKAIEGSAKGVPAERIAAAVRLVVTQLDTAAVALRGGPLGTDTVAIAAGEFAITAGLHGRDVSELGRSDRPPADVIVGLRVAGTLAALGVPPSETVALVRATLRSGGAPTDLLALPSRVQAQVAQGATPAQAAAGLARAAAAQSRRGPPPDRGPPANPGRPHP